jgi:hypothetical protein
VLIGPGQPIILPAFVEEYGFANCRTDYEAELAIIMVVLLQLKGSLLKSVGTPHI